MPVSEDNGIALAMSFDRTDVKLKAICRFKKN